jgi:hypothetical protein
MLGHESSNGRDPSHEITRRVAAVDARLSAYNSSVTFLLAYALTNIVLFSFGAAGEYARWPDDLLRATAVGAARGFGYCLNFNVALIVFLASRGVLSLLRSTPLNACIPFDKAMPLFHSFVGYATLACAAMHGACHSVGFARRLWADSGFLGWRFCVWTGFLLLLVFSGMALSARKPRRDANFERFMYTHLAGASLFVTLLVFHGVYLGRMYTFKWIAGPLALYAGDRVHRKLVEKEGTVFIRVRARARQGADIVKLELPRVFRFKAGQYAELKIPSISQFQWHPFTIASAPHEPTMVFYVKAVGDKSKSWTHRLHRLFQDEQDFDAPVSNLGELEVLCRGPYGAPAQHTDQYDRVVLISGGVGSTPFLSVAKHIDHVIRGNDSLGAPKTCGPAQQPGDRKSAADGSDGSDSASNPSGSEADDAAFETIDMDDLGVSRVAAGGAGRHPNRKNGGALKKRATIKRAVSATEPAASVDVETWTESLLSISATGLLNSGLLWLILVRFAGNLVALAVHEADLARQGTHIFRSTGVTSADLAAGVFVSATLVAQLLVETAAGVLDLIDLLLLLPLISFQTAVDVLSIAGALSGRGSFTFHSFAIVWPLALTCYLLRYFRVLGASLVESVSANHRQLRSLDFVWTTPCTADDDWLCSDLSKTISREAGSSRAVRLHRFITREGPPDAEAGEATDAIPGFRNNFGRPCWDSLFTRLARNSPNGVRIGVFVCGPPELTAAVKAAALHAMIESRRRGLVFRGAVGASRSLKPDFAAQFDGDEVSVYSEGYGRDAGSAPSGSALALDRSFNVKFVVREENF